VHRFTRLNFPRVSCVLVLRYCFGGYRTFAPSEDITPYLTHRQPVSHSTEFWLIALQTAVLLLCLYTVHILHYPAPRQCIIPFSGQMCIAKRAANRAAEKNVNYRYRSINQSVKFFLNIAAQISHWKWLQ